MLKRIKAFTLMELTVTIVVISIFALFGIPNFQKAVVKVHERGGITNLKTIQGANEIYRMKNGGVYLPGGPLNLAGINAGLEIRIFDDNLTYSYSRSADTAYTCTAQWTGTGAFTLRVNQNAITASNPCCLAGACRVATAACP